jgi:elongation factor P--beta-lysine ligase
MFVAALVVMERMREVYFHGITFANAQKRAGNGAVVRPVFVRDARSKFRDDLLRHKVDDNRFAPVSRDRRRNGGIVTDGDARFVLHSRTTAEEQQREEE